MAWITPIYDRQQSDVDNETDKGFLNESDWTRILNNYNELKTKYEDFFSTGIPQVIPEAPTLTYYITDTDFNTVCQGINIMYSLLRKTIYSYIMLPENYIGGLESEGLYIDDLNNIEKDLELIYLNIDSVMDTASSAQVATSFGGGNGTQNNPYLITSCAEYAYLCEQSKTNSFEGIYFKITKYLNFNNKYGHESTLQIAPYSTYPFKGNLDGQGYRMRLLYSQANRRVFTEKVAIIGYTDGATIKNLENHGGAFYNSSESWDNTSGDASVLINQCNSSTIENCKVYNSLVFYGGSGFISTANNSNINNCYVYDISTNQSKVGMGSAGFILNANNCNINNCIVENVELSDSQDGTLYVGGFISISNECTIQNCKVLEANIDGNITSTANYITTSRSAAFIGKSIENTISKCFAQGIVNGREHVAGFIGEINGGNIDQCYAYCDVTGVTGNVTGFIGIISTYPITITNCYARGTINRYTPSNITPLNIYLSGFLPQVTQTNNIADKCYSAVIYSYDDYETVTSKTVIYGICYVNASAIRTYVSGISYYDSSLTKAPTEEQTGEIGYARTTKEMKIKSTFFTFDFNNIWNIDENINNGYPYLRNV